MIFVRPRIYECPDFALSFPVYVVISEIGTTLFGVVNYIDGVEVAFIYLINGIIILINAIDIEMLRFPVLIKILRKNLISVSLLQNRPPFRDRESPMKKS
jgi:hypothetical protein